MTQRIDYKKVGPDAFNAMLGIEACVHLSLIHI